MRAKGSGDGFPVARNLGVKICEGDAILLNNDTLLDQNVIGTLVTFIGARAYCALRRDSL